MSSVNCKAKPITVLGAGSFGTALAILLARNNNETLLWGRDADQIALMQKQRLNQKYLPDAPLPENLRLTSNFEQAVAGVDDILVVTPSHAFSKTLKQLKPLLSDNARVVWACKGLEPDSAEFLDERLLEILGDKHPKAVLSGPTFAKELAVGLPTAITLASDNQQFVSELSTRLASETFRVYLSSDLKGVQFGGALKNVIAIGAGIADGLGFGANARTALITRGLAEMMRMGEKLGGSQETFTGMAGLGDLVLTCTDNQSRNRRFGLALGKGASIEQAAKEIGQVVEGVRNTKEVHHLAERLGVDMPICQAVYSILYQEQDPRQAAKELLTRELKVEGD